MTLRERHARYYLALVQSNPQHWQRIDTELGQIRRAWQWVATSADQKSVRDYVEAVFPYLQLRGLWREALEWAECELQATQIEQDKTAEFFSLMRVGDAHDKLGNQQQLIEYYERAYTLLPSIRSEQHRYQVESMIASRLGMAHLKNGNAPKAFDYYRRALELARHTKNWQAEFVVLMSMESAYRRLGSLRQAESLQEQMYNLAYKQGNHKYLALALKMAGNALFDAGDFRKASQKYQQGLNHARAARDQDLEVDFLHSLAGIAQSEGALAKVAEFYEQALTLVRSMGNPVQESDLLGGLGDIYLQAGEPERAIQYLEQNLIVARRVGNRAVEGGRLASLGQAYHRLGEFEAAVRYYEEALRVSRETGERQIEARLLSAIGDLANDRGQEHQAIEYYEQALRPAQDIGDERLSADIRWNLALVLERQGSLERAYELIKTAVSYEQSVGAPNAKEHADYLAQLARRLKQMETSPPCLDAHDSDRAKRGGDTSIRLGNASI